MLLFILFVRFGLFRIWIPVIEPGYFRKLHCRCMRILLRLFGIPGSAVNRFGVCYQGLDGKRLLQSVNMQYFEI